jgi:hypothetical protein
MFKRLSKWIVVVPLVLVTGGHWALLQSVAWVSMAARYSHDSMLKEALVKTFDGQHPCGLCKLVEKGKSAEKKQDTLRVDVKFDFLPARIAPQLYPPPAFTFPTSEPGTPPTRTESPPSPPPRLA